MKEILTWYGSENPGVLSNLARMLNHGALGGSGKMLILPVDQGFEHGPLQSFSKNPKAFDPFYHFKLAIEAGCNAYAAPLGFLEAASKDYAGEIPLILKVNSSDSLYKSKEAPIPSLTSCVEDALRLGCLGIGFTIYPGSAQRKAMYEEVVQQIKEARKVGLVVVVWAYPRGEGVSKRGETALDVTAYAAHIAAQMGAHIIKVKPSQAYVESLELRSFFEQNNLSLDKLSDRTRYVVASAFHGRRIVIFSGGQAKSQEGLLEEIRELSKGGAFGSIIGRNAFQREKSEALKLLREVVKIYSQSSKTNSTMETVELIV